MLVAPPTLGGARVADILVKEKVGVDVSSVLGRSGFEGMPRHGADVDQTAVLLVLALLLLIRWGYIKVS